MAFLIPPVGAISGLGIWHSIRGGQKLRKRNAVVAVKNALKLAHAAKAKLAVASLPVLAALVRRIAVKVKIASVVAKKKNSLN